MSIITARRPSNRISIELVLKQPRRTAEPRSAEQHFFMAARLDTTFTEALFYAAVPRRRVLCQTAETAGGLTFVYLRRPPARLEYSDYLYSTTIPKHSGVSR